MVHQYDYTFDERPKIVDEKLELAIGRSIRLLAKIINTRWSQLLSVRLSLLSLRKLTKRLLQR